MCAASGKVQKAIEEESFEDEIREDGKATEEYCFSCPAERTDTPLLTMPGACTGKALGTTASVDSWQEPGDLNRMDPDLSEPRWKTATSPAARDGLRKAELQPEIADGGPSRRRKPRARNRRPG